MRITAEKVLIGGFGLVVALFVIAAVLACMNEAHGLIAFILISAVRPLTQARACGPFGAQGGCPQVGGRRTTP